MSAGERSDHSFTKLSVDMVYTSMPWKEGSIVEQRMRIVLRLQDGESMASLCGEFGISPVTGYKFYERYKECDLEGLTDRGRTPYRYANKLLARLEAMIVSMRRERPTWGARKHRDRLLRKVFNDVRVPACSTIQAIPDRHGLVARQRRSRTKTEGTPLSQGLTPNALWCADYKGEFMLGDRKYCYPLTVSDHASRYLLLCDAMESVKEQTAFPTFARLFKERGFPHAEQSLPYCKCRRKTACRRPHHVGKEKQSISNESGWMASTADCKYPFASRPTHEELRSRSLNKILNLS